MGVLYTTFGKRPEGVGVFTSLEHPGLYVVGLFQSCYTWLFLTLKDAGAGY